MTTVSANEAWVGRAHFSPTRVPKRIRTLIAENSPAPGEVIKELIRLEDYIEIVGKVTDGQEAIEAVSVLHPDLLLMDVRLPHIDGVTAYGILSQNHPGMHIVLMFEQESRRLRSQIGISNLHYLLHKPRFVEEFCRVLPTIKLRMEAADQAEPATRGGP